MKRKLPSAELAQARGWALRLTALVQRALQEQPGADPDKVRHKLMQLAQRLPKGSASSPARGRALAKSKTQNPRHKKRNGTQTNRRRKGEQRLG